MTNPCDKCKRAVCPNKCYPLNDYKRGLKNRLRKAEKEHKKIVRGMK